MYPVVSTSVAIYQEVQDISNSLEANDHCKSKCMSVFHVILYPVVPTLVALYITDKQEEEDIEDLHMEQGQ